MIPVTIPHCALCGAPDVPTFKGSAFGDNGEMLSRGTRIPHKCAWITDIEQRLTRLENAVCPSTEVNEKD